MKNNDKHTEFLSNLETPFSESKDDMWARMEAKIESSSQKKTFQLSWKSYSVAASVLLLIGVTSFLQFFSTTVSSGETTHQMCILPDGSVVELNSSSSITYHPYWWNFSREVKFKGEAFFEVEKGSNFKVISDNGTTEVLGTSFNIDARGANYEVYCKTGKVRVSNPESTLKFEITPGEFAQLDNIKNTGSKDKGKESDFLAWKENKFHFISTPLRSVFRTIEKHHGVVIHVNNPEIGNSIHTGSFVKSTDIEVTLNLICKTFNLTFVEVKKGEYKITNK